MLTELLPQDRNVRSEEEVFLTNTTPKQSYLYNKQLLFIKFSPSHHQQRVLQVEVALNLCIET